MLVLSNICRGKNRICWWLLSSETHGSKSHGVLNTAVELYITSLAFLISKTAIWWLLFSPQILWPLLANITLSATVFTSLKNRGAARGTRSFSYCSSCNATCFCSYDLCLPFSWLWKHCLRSHQKPNPPLVRQVPFPTDSARTIHLKFHTFPLHSQFLLVSWMISISTHTYCNDTYVCFCMSSWELHILLAVFFDSSICAFLMENVHMEESQKIANKTSNNSQEGIQK